jgi:carbonic anhydrase
MERLIKIEKSEDILAEYKNTPVCKLLEYHNLNRPFDTYINAEILIGMCMDNRKHIHIPDNFAYIIRSGGANLRYSEFKVSYAIAIGHVAQIALIGHNHCAMSNLVSRKNEFVDGLVNTAGWQREQAEQHFMNYAPMHEIEDEKDFIIGEAQRLRNKYPKVQIVPLFYLVEDNLLYFIKEK